MAKKIVIQFEPTKIECGVIILLVVIGLILLNIGCASSREVQVLQKPIDPEVNQPHRIEVIRLFNNKAELELLKKAEATFPKREEILNFIKKTPSKRRSTSSTEENLWWYDEFDGTRLPYAITESAVTYYQQKIEEFRIGKFSKNITILNSSFKYIANIKYQQEFIHEQHKYKDVYVVTMDLNWRQYCGQLCAMTFQKKRMVVLKGTGEVLGVFFDGKVDNFLVS